jgi:hypothetical protein
MSIFVLSCLVAVLASMAGGLVAALIAEIPLPILARAATDGRYAGLGAGEPGSGFPPSAGRRVLSLAAGIAAA